MKVSKKYIARTLLAWIMAVALASCTGAHKIDDRLEEIKEMGDTNPTAALQAYDSLKNEAASLPEYQRNKYALLGVRLRDKADILHTSDSCIRELVPYFEKAGDNKDRQEAYYYAGSVYRDLQDTPRSLEYFRKSADCAEKGKVDSLMLRNCYSQLSALYFNVQDFPNAKEKAEAECSISKKLGIEDDGSLTNLSNIYIRTGNFSAASRIMRKVLERQQGKIDKERDTDILFDLLFSFSYSHTQDTLLANRCYNLICHKRHFSMNATRCNAIANYFRSIAQYDSCIHYYKQALTLGGTSSKYDASRNLFCLYDSLGNRDLAYKYACEYMDISAELDLGGRQEQAATANNLYQYYKDREEQALLIEENKRARMRLWTALALAIAVVMAAYALHTHRKYRRVRLLQSISSAQHDREADKGQASSEKELMEQIKDRAEANRQTREQLRSDLAIAEREQLQKDARLDSQAQNLERMRKEQESLEAELKQKSLETQRLETQNAQLSRKAHQAELTSSHEDIMERFHLASKGQYTLTEEDWNQFMTAIDQAYPSFSQKVTSAQGTMKREQERVCYLLTAGFTPSQACALIGKFSRSTVMRWCKEYRESL